MEWALAAGVAIGWFNICIGQFQGESPFGLLVIIRVLQAAVMALLIVLWRQPWRLPREGLRAEEGGAQDVPLALPFAFGLDFAFELETKGLIFCLPGLHSKGPALYVQSAMCSVSFAGPTHVAEQVKLQP